MSISKKILYRIQASLSLKPVEAWVILSRVASKLAKNNRRGLMLIKIIKKLVFAATATDVMTMTRMIRRRQWAMWSLTLVTPIKTFCSRRRWRRCWPLKLKKPKKSGRNRTRALIRSNYRRAGRNRCTDRALVLESRAIWMSGSHQVWANSLLLCQASSVVLERLQCWASIKAARLTTKPSSIDSWTAVPAPWTSLNSSMSASRS